MKVRNIIVPVNILLATLSPAAFASTESGEVYKPSPLFVECDESSSDFAPVLGLPESVRKGDLEHGVPVVVVVDKTSHTTHVLQLQGSGSVKEVVEILAVPNATGKASTPTPTGRTTVRSKQLDPVWIPPKSIDPRQRAVGPYSKTGRNPLGVARIRLNRGLIALHGTNKPEQIGRSVSHGCIRHHNQDIMRLYPLLEVGTAVYLVHSFQGTQVRMSDCFAPDAS